MYTYFKISSITLQSYNAMLHPRNNYVGYKKNDALDSFGNFWAGRYLLVDLLIRFIFYKMQ